MDGNHAWMACKHECIDGLHASSWALKVLIFATNDFRYKGSSKLIKITSEGIFVFQGLPSGVPRSIFSHVNRNVKKFGLKDSNKKQKTTELQYLLKGGIDATEHFCHRSSETLIILTFRIQIHLKTKKVG